MIIGELINSSRKAMRPLMESWDKEAIQEIAKAQEAAGATYLDVNCGSFVADEAERLVWLVDIVQEVTALPLCLDSPNAAALAAALPHVKNGQPLINSISAESERFEAILPLVLQYQTKVVALAMDDGGIPVSAEARLVIAKRLHADLRAAGVATEDIYLDPLVQPLATTAEGAAPLLDAVRQILEYEPQLNCLAGLSNISFGLPNRALLNRYFLIQAVSAGMDAFILNPLDKALMGAYYAASALMGKDKFCAQYLKAHRQGFFSKND